MKALFLALLVAVLTGCSITPSRGFYEGQEAIGWKHSIQIGSGGVNEYATTKRGISVTFSTTERGSIYMSIYSPSDQPVFRSPDVTLRLPDGTTKHFPATSPLAIHIGDADVFTLEIPEFEMAGHSFPKLEATFRWNASTRYYIRGIQ